METQSLSQEAHLSGKYKPLEVGWVSQNNNISNTLSKMRGSAIADAASFVPLWYYWI